MVVVLQSKFMSRDIFKGRLVKENHQQRSSWMTILVHGVVLTRKLNVPRSLYCFKRQLESIHRTENLTPTRQLFTNMTKTSLNEVFQYRTTCECEEGRGAML